MAKGVLRPEDSGFLRRDILCETLQMGDGLKISEAGPVRVMPEKVETGPWWLTQLDWFLPEALAKAVSDFGADARKLLPAPTTSCRSLPARISVFERLPAPQKTANSYALTALASPIEPAAVGPLVETQTLRGEDCLDTLLQSLYEPDQSETQQPSPAQNELPNGVQESCTELKKDGVKVTLEMLLDPSFNCDGLSF